MKFSIITAAYNSGATLRDTMESVLRQSHTDWEHIIVDGASNDGTLELIHEMEPRYGGRLRWISEPDRGIYDAMNKGIAMASGDVIGILNSDDFYSSPDVLQRVTDEMTDEAVDAVFGDIHFVNDDDMTRCVRYYSSRFIRRWMMLFGYQPAHPSFYCRKRCYDTFGAFDTDFHVSADFEHLLRLIYKNRIRTRYMAMDFVTMRTGGASTAGLSSHKRIMKDHYKAYGKHGLYLSYMLDPLRYPIKVVELAVSKFSSHKKIQSHQDDGQV